MEKKERFYIIDGYGQIYRSYYAFMSRPLLDEDGHNVSAVYGFFNTLMMILRDYKPEYIAVALDSKGKTFRHSLYPEYKANRQKTPEDLHEQIPRIIEILDKMRIKHFIKEGAEADDVIATLVNNLTRRDIEQVVVTGDKDLLQLVSDSTFALRPPKKDEKSWRLCGKKEVEEIFGVRPDQICDYLTILGDSSDNVPGISGIGEKGAVKLLKEYDTLENAYANISLMKGAVKTKLEAAKDGIELSHTLITLKNDLFSDDGFDLSDCKTDSIDWYKAVEIFLKMRSKTLAATAKGFLTGKYDGSDGMKNGTSQSSSYGRSDVEKSESGGKKPQYDIDDFGGRGVITVPDDFAVSLNDKTHLTGFALKNKIKEYSEQGLNGSDSGFLFEKNSVSSDKKEKDYAIAKDSDDGYSASLFNKNFESDDGNAAPKAGSGSHVSESGSFFSKSASQSESHVSGKESHISGRESYRSEAEAEVFSGNNGTGGGIKPYFDVQIAQYLLDSETSEPTLEDIALKNNVDMNLDENEKIRRLVYILQTKLKEKGLEDVFYKLEMPLITVLAEMEAAGILLDRKALLSYQAELKDNISGIEKTIFTLCGHEFNIASPKQLQDVLFKERGLEPIKKTKSGYSTDSDVLETLSYYDTDPVPALILRFRALTKLLSTYVSVLPQLTDKNGRIHTTFLQTGTATGRLSSKNPNLQNIPVRTEEGRRIRSAFVAKEGCTLLSADYAQIELAVLASLSGDKVLCDSFIKGEDVHRNTASVLFSKLPDLITDSERRIAKTINFGVIYGMSAFRLSGELKIPRSEATNYIETYFKVHSGVTSFIEKIKADAARTGYVRTVMGHIRRVLNITSANKTIRSAAERIAVNSVIQGTAAEIVKCAMLSLSSALKKGGYQAKILLQVHDEMILEVPDGELEALKALVKEKMEEVSVVSLPLRVSISTGKNWGCL